MSGMTKAQIQQDTRERIAKWIERECDREERHDDRSPGLSMQTVRAFRHVAQKIRLGNAETTT